MPIYAPYGALLIFSRDYFAKGGDFAHPGFLYGEEIFVAEACRETGLEVILWPELKADHREHSATGVVQSKSKIRFQYESLTRLIERYFS